MPVTQYLIHTCSKLQRLRFIIQFNNEANLRSSIASTLPVNNQSASSILILPRSIESITRFIITAGFTGHSFPVTLKFSTLRFIIIKPETAYRLIPSSLCILCTCFLRSRTTGQLFVLIQSNAIVYNRDVLRHARPPEWSTAPPFTMRIKLILNLIVLTECCPISLVFISFLILITRNCVNIYVFLHLRRRITIRIPIATIRKIKTISPSLMSWQTSTTSKQACQCCSHSNFR